MLHSDFVEEYHPFEDYFKKLTPWDKKTSPIKELANTIKTEDQEFFELSLRRWLIATVASMLHPKIVNQQVFILHGDQGKGKTT